MVRNNNGKSASKGRQKTLPEAAEHAAGEREYYPCKAGHPDGCAANLNREANVDVLRDTSIVTVIECTVCGKRHEYCKLAGQRERKL